MSYTHPQTHTLSTHSNDADKVLPAAGTLWEAVSRCLDVDESFLCAKPYVNVLTAGQLTEEFPLSEIFVLHRNGWFVLGHTAERSIWGTGSYIDPNPQTCANCSNSLLPIVIKICITITVFTKDNTGAALVSVYFQLIVCSAESAGFIPMKN